MKLVTAVKHLKEWGSDASLVARGLLLHRKFREFTMVGPTIYAGNISLLQYVRDVPGCVVECGVWRGGMSAGMAEILGNSRKYYLLDSFEGLPPAQEIDGPEAAAWQQNKDSPTYFDNCRAEVEIARRAMAMSPARDVTYVPGWFSDTLAELQPPAGIAVLRLDGDWYESTIQCLRALYPQVVPGGLVIIDDYYAWDGCSKAVHEYLAETESRDRLRSKHRVSYIVKGTRGLSRERRSVSS